MSIFRALEEGAFAGIIASLNSLFTQTETFKDDAADSASDAQKHAQNEVAFQDSALVNFDKGAKGYATDASGSATTATNQAGIATTKANEASTDADTATTQAGIATTQAGISTTKANEASDSADTASTQAGIATTQAGISTTQAGISTDKAGEAETWAEGLDAAVVALGGEKSSKGWAGASEEFYDLITGLTNYEGVWSTLTGAKSAGITVEHNGEFWFLLTGLADVTTSEPSDSNADWKLLTATILRQTLSAVATEYPFASWTVAGGESEIDIGHSGQIDVYRNGSQLTESNYTLTGTTLTLNFELVSGDVVRVLKMQSSRAAKVQDLGSITGAVEIDFSLGDQVIGAPTGELTLTFAGGIPGFVLGFNLYFTAIQTINWPASVIWAGGEVKDATVAPYRYIGSIDENNVVTIDGLIQGYSTV